VSRARRRAGQSANRLAKLIFAALFLVIGAIAWYAIDARKNVSALDAAGCRTDGAHDKLVLLIDRSDALSAIQKIDIQGRIKQLIEDAKIGTSVTLSVLDAGTPQLVTTLFQGCRPDDGQNVNRLVQNERMIRERWQNDFLGPLDETLQSSLSDSPSSTSPLMEAIQLVALTGFKYTPAPGYQQRLVVVSDMIQNTDGYNQYKDSLDPIQFNTLPYAARVAASLDATDIEILYVGRPSATQIQNTAHATFWDAWFRQNGGRITSIERISGG